MLGKGDGGGSGAGGGAGDRPGGGPGAGRSAGEEGAAVPAEGRLPPVIDRVPTRDKVVFLTYDDGAGADPRLIDLVRERRLPVALFLTDSVAGPGYAHFARLRGVGASLQNNTLDHPALRGLPYAGQRAEICGQQRKLRARFGVRPRFLRPPHGVYDTTTLRAAADCGIAAVVLSRVTVRPDGRLDFAHGPHELSPGDIVSVPSGRTGGAGGAGGAPAQSLADRTARLLTELESRDLRVANPADYWGA
ncbi:polysaccharide deacetylase family protein [Streptomyces sp. NPDC055058]